MEYKLDITACLTKAVIWMAVTVALAVGVCHMMGVNPDTFVQQADVQWVQPLSHVPGKLKAGMPHLNIPTSLPGLTGPPPTT